MDPKKIRAGLQIAASVLAFLSAVVVALQKVDITNITAVIGAIAGVVGFSFGKASEAPGGIPRWKIPEHILKFIPK